MGTSWNIRIISVFLTFVFTSKEFWVGFLFVCFLVYFFSTGTNLTNLAMVWSRLQKDHGRWWKPTDNMYKGF